MRKTPFAIRLVASIVLSAIMVAAMILGVQAHSFSNFFLAVGVMAFAALAFALRYPDWWHRR